MNILRLVVTFTVTGIIACSASAADETGAVTSRDTAQPTPSPAAQCSTGQGEEGCLYCCVGTGPMKQVVDETVACLDACQGDKRCENRCHDAFDRGCEANADACDKARTCYENSCQSAQNDPSCSGGDDDDC